MFQIRYSTAFEYAPLTAPTCFRLARILPGRDTDVVSVELYDTDLGTEPAFESLSYSWSAAEGFSLSKLESVENKEDAKRERPILCNGKTHHVTTNLYLALGELRRMKLETSIWADQLCINQQDEKEKVAQLAIMTQIYTSATTVLIWLGPLSWTKSWALDFMEALPDQFAPIARTASAESSTSNRPVLGKFTRSFEVATSFSKSLGVHARWLATLTVLSRGWFQRTWTLQEFLLAKRIKLLMGSREVPPSAIIKAATQLQEFWRSDPLAVQTGLSATTSININAEILPLANLFAARDAFQNGKRYTSEEYLAIVRLRKATVPKDRVFAGAALLDEHVPLSVNYYSTTRDVYYAFAAELVWPSAGIRMLSLVGSAIPRVEGLPSWAPDLSKVLRPQALRNCGGQTFQSSIAGSTDAFRVDEKLLHIKGAHWSTVKDIGESIWSFANYYTEAYNSDDAVLDGTTLAYMIETSTTESQEHFGLMFALLNDIGTMYAPTGERTMDALWKTLLGGATSKSEEHTTVWQDRFYHWFALTYLCIGSDLRMKKNSSSIPEKWLVPLIRDLPLMEERVALFLETHDHSASADNTPTQPLRVIISDLAHRLYDAESEEESTTLKGAVGELLAMIRGDPSHQPAMKFGYLLNTIYDGRRIFSTTNGHIGISSEAIKAGDMIYLVPGAEVPYVFRPVEGVTSTFTLVGEAYVHGLMDKSDFSDHAFEPIQVV